MVCSSGGSYRNFKLKLQIATSQVDLPDDIQIKNKLLLGAMAAAAGSPWYHALHKGC